METSVPDETRNQSSYSQHELLQRCQPATNTWVGDLGLIQGGQHGKHANAHSGEESSTVHVVDVLSTSLDSTAEKEDEAAYDDGNETACPVGKGTDVNIAR